MVTYWYTDKDGKEKQGRVYYDKNGQVSHWEKKSPRSKEREDELDRRATINRQLAKRRKEVAKQKRRKTDPDYEPEESKKKKTAKSGKKGKK